MQLPGALQVCALELAPELALAQAQEELLRGLLVDPALGGTGVELGQQRDEFLVSRARLEEMGARTAMDPPPPAIDAGT